MNREEILARSQRESQGQDVVDLEVSKAGMKLGWLIVVCLLAFVSVVDAIVFERMNSEVFFAVLAATSAVFFSKYLKLRKRHELIIAIIEAVAAAAFLISWMKEIRTEKKISQSELAEMVGVSRNTISSIETGQFSPTAKLALILCIALEKKFEDVFFF